MTPSSKPEPELENPTSDPVAAGEQPVAGAEPDPVTTPAGATDAPSDATVPVESAPVESSAKSAAEPITPVEKATPTEATPTEATPTEAGPVEKATPAKATTVTPAEAATAPAETTTTTLGSSVPPTEATAAPVAEAPTAWQVPAGTSVPAAATAPVVVEDLDGDDDDDDDLDEELALEPSDRYSTALPLVGAVVGLVAVAVLLLVALGLPAVKSGPHKLPVGVAGSKDITDQLVPLFKGSAAQNRTFSVSVFPNEDAMRKALENRKIYGGLSVDGQGASMLVSSGGSIAAADALSGFATNLSNSVQTQIPVRDIITLPSRDPRGAGLIAAGIPLTLAAILPALLLAFMYRRRVGVQLAAAAGVAVLTGLALSAILSIVLGTTDGSNFLLVSAGLAGGVLSISLLLLGLFAVGGRVAAGIGAVIILFVAQPLSGLATAPEWLPQPWGDLGQLLPPGANGTLLRSTAYFDGHGAGQALLVLGGWAVIGLLLIGFGQLIHSTPASDPVPLDDDAADDEAADAGPLGASRAQAVSV